MFNGFNKSELLDAAALLGVDADSSMKNDDIKAAIEDAGYSEDDYNELTGGTPQEDATVEEASDEDVAEEPEEAPADTSPAVYGMFTGANPSYGTPYGTFGRGKPAFKTTQDTLDTLMINYPGKFRKASAKEAK